MSCVYCGREKHGARGYCSACYSRLRRRGTLERKNVVNSGKCGVEGCERRAFAKNLCQSHYNAADHPLKNIWKNVRSRNDSCPLEWDDFNIFLQVVGPRPSNKHQLRRIDPLKPFSAENIKWLGPVSSDHYPAAKRAVYGREWNLQKRFNITGAEFSAMLAKQNGVCAICGNRETHVHKSGKLKELSVDHCHDTRKVRGLLCVNCNRGLGYFKDSIERINRAAEYLRKNGA